MSRVARRVVVSVLAALVAACAATLDLAPPTPDQPFVFYRQFGTEVSVSADVGTSTHEDFKAWLRANTHGWVRHREPLPRGRWMVTVRNTELLFAESMVFATTKDGGVYAKEFHGRLGFFGSHPP